MMTVDPRPAARIVDKDALRVARLLSDECAACGRPPGSAHHVIPRGERGDDVPENIVLLCGSGNTGCHGAWHGNPYTVTAGGAVAARIDALWVARRIGQTLLESRPDVIEYVRRKLGPVPAAEYLHRRYLMEAPQ